VLRAEARVNELWPLVGSLQLGVRYIYLTWRAEWGALGGNGLIQDLVLSRRANEY